LVGPKFSRTGRFPGIADAIVQALVAIELAVAAVVDAIGLWAKPRWTMVKPGTTTYQARLWDCVICSQSMTIRFPPASEANRGAEIAICKLGAPTVTVTPISGWIDGSVSESGPAADHTRVYLSSGEGWHSIA
jgi:hypothetical protein